MKAITLTQPWATLVAIGAKRIETRSWGTRYRGELGIHAAKTFPEYARERFFNWEFSESLKEAGILHLDDLPLGCMLSICNLDDCARICKVANGVELVPSLEEHPKFLHDLSNTWRYPLSDKEMIFGDYRPGRYGWMLSNNRQLPAPIPVRGMMGLWEWDCSTDNAD